MRPKASTVCTIAALAGLCPLCAAAEEAQSPTDFATQSADHERRIADLAGVDPHQPRTLDARFDYAQFLYRAGSADCKPHLDAADAQLAPIFSAGPAAILAWPEGLADSTSLAQSIQSMRGQCAGDADAARKAFQASIELGLRAVEMFRENWDFEDMAVAQFNIAFARRELGDLGGALQDLEQVLAWDREFGFREELINDATTLLRWRGAGVEPDTAEVSSAVDPGGETKARFEFRWRPHQVRWTTEAERANLRNGRLTSVKLGYVTSVDARRERDDWVLASRLEGEPSIETSRGGQPGMGLEQIQEVIGSLGMAMPDVLVGADGSFKGLRNLDAHREKLGTEIRDMILRRTPPDKRAEVEANSDRTLSAILNPELLTSIAAGEWDIAVGAWIDGEFDHGDWYELEFSEPIPGISDRPVSKRMTFKVSRWLPCSPDGPPECVEVLARIVPDSGELAAAIADFVGKLFPAASKAEFDEALRSMDYQFDLRYRLVTEPDSLMPWSLEERRYLYAASIEGGERQVFARRDRKLETAD